MDSRDPVVLQAIRNVAARYTPASWWAAPARERTRAIYEEIRRLDVEALRRRTLLPEPSEKAEEYELA
jgi:hypothetical protein